MSCPLCKLVNGDVRTKLYYEDKVIIIVKDLDPKGYKYRILCCWKEHKRCDDLMIIERKYMLDLLRSVANEQKEPYTLDIDKYSIPEHCHFQANMG